MSWTSVDVIQVIGAVGTLVGVIGATILLVRNGVKSEVRGAETKATLETIHVNVNDRFSRLEAENAALRLIQAERSGDPREMALAKHAQANVLVQAANEAVRSAKAAAELKKA